MSAEIRRLAESIVNEPESDDVFAAEYSPAAKMVAQAWLDDQAWIDDLEDNPPRLLDRPTGPGLWVCYPRPNGPVHQITVLDLDERDIKRGAPYHTLKVYGPIPRVA